MAVRKGSPPSARSGAVSAVSEGWAPGRGLPMEAPELGPGLVERLEQLATCPLCGGPFEDPVLLACEHSFCRACLACRWGGPPAPGTEAPPITCPRCGQLCPRRSLRSNVRLAVEVRISRGLRDKLAEPGARTSRRRGGRIPTMGCLDPQGEVRRGRGCGGWDPGATGEWGGRHLPRRTSAKGGGGRRKAKDKRTGLTTSLQGK